MDNNVDKKGIIMVADDAAVIRNIIKTSLQDLFEVVETKNGDDTIKVLQEYNFDVDGVFLDLVMPDSDGYKVLETLHVLGIKVPITVISGDDSTETIQNVCNTYNVDYISKPLGKSQIISAAEMMQRKKTIYNENL